MDQILFLGDSFTAGYGLFPDQSMTALIQKELIAANKDLRVIAAGVSGDTTADAFARLPRYLIAENEIRFVVLELGTNDIIQGFSVSNIRDNFRRIVAAIRAFDPKIQIFLIHMEMFEEFGIDQAYEHMFPEVANELNLILLPFPFSDVAGNPDLNLSDGIHPNAKGTEIVATNVWNSLQTHL